MVKKTLYIIPFLLLSFLCSAQMKVTAALDSNTILLGDQLLLHFNITQANGAEYLSADFQTALDSVDQIELLEIQAPVNAGNQIKQSIRITSFEDGTHIIPPIKFSSKQGGQTTSSLSNAVYLVVAPIGIDTSNMQLMPIKDIIEEEGRLSDWIHYILVPLAILAIIGLIAFLIIRLRGKPEDIHPKPAPVYIPAHVLAKEKIQALQQRQLWQNGHIKEYYSEISFIAREYLENRYQINALESVVGEIRRDMKNQDIPSDLQQSFLQLLQTTDMVKFAKVKPGEDTHSKTIGQLETFVEQTKQIALPPSESTENSSDIS